ncbi:MAG: hypothetical protein QNJ06_22865 [Kiloniellales bacterium]|nr:hypothetical protein [Kiloniellales bacterium]MDJ0972748.1 hypothetical protein [Kiloniellales bacterium]MDJ0981362.1 hypothetical protein [Kiloniellales bacterium]
MNSLRAVRIVMGPSIPETGEVARAVTLEDGSGQVQTYSRSKKAWVNGGSTFQSLHTADDVSIEYLKLSGFDEGDIENILRRPEDEAVG